MKKRVKTLWPAVLTAWILAGMTAAAQESPEHIVVTYVSLDGAPSDLGMVQDAVNEITVPEINVEVEFLPFTAADTFTSYSTLIAGGETLDLMLLYYQNPSVFINSGFLYSLNGLIEEYAPTIAELSEEYPIYEGSMSGNLIYGISPVMPTYGQQGNLMMRRDWFEETGIPEKELYTWDELTEIFTAIKEKHPSSYPLGVLGSDVTVSTSLYDRFGILDTLGSGIDTGVLMSTDSTEVRNLFETEEYHDFLIQMQEWYNAGFIMPDAATTDGTIVELTDREIIGSSASVYTTERFADYETGFGKFGGAVALRTTEAYLPSRSGSTCTFWTIPITSSAPWAAMKFLELTYADADLMNLIQWGIEGRHYVKTDAESVIAFPEGVDSDTSGYYNTLGLWGDRRNQYFWSEASTREKNDAFTETAFQNPTMASGYHYDSEEMANQVIAVDNVLQQYLPVLETGSADSLEATYQAMLSALDAAGIQEIIEDNQRQFDAWLEAKEAEEGPAGR